MNSRNKGKRGELEAAKAWRDHVGTPLRRTAQVDGSLSADLTGIDGLHLEVKRRARIAATDYMLQAMRDSEGKDKIPTVLMRQDHFPEWLVVVRLSDLVGLASVIIEEQVREQ